MRASATPSDEPRRVTDTALCGDYARGQRAGVAFRPEVPCDFATGVRVDDVEASAGGDFASGMRHTSTPSEVVGDFATGPKRRETRRGARRTEGRRRRLVTLILGSDD
jgi:hypothetical protein